LEKNNPEKLFFISSATTFFFIEKSCQKRTCARRWKNVGKIQGPAMRLNFFSLSSLWILQKGFREKNQKRMPLQNENRIRITDIIFQPEANGVYYIK